MNLRHYAVLVLATTPWLAFAAACVDGATPDCTKPNSGCVVAPATDGSADVSSGDGSVTDTATSDATDANADARAEGGDADAGDAKID